MMTTPEMRQSRRRSTNRLIIDGLATSLPLLLVIGLVVTYAIDPEFYLEYIIYWKTREYQVVELITFSCAMLAGLLCMATALRMWFSPVRSHYRIGIIVIAIIAAASLFFAGEEISWGQSYLGWDTPDTYREYSVETNLHNTDIPVQSLGSVFIICTMMVLPLLWHFRRRFSLPAGLEPSIAELPIVISAVIAFLWKEYKTVYIWLNEDHEAIDFYVEFVEQINEHKEMLVAVTLLLYGLYRLRWWSRCQQEPGRLQSAPDGQ